MDAFTQMASALQALNPPKLDRKQQQVAWNKRYYERNRERWPAYQVCKDLSRWIRLFRAAA